MIDRKWLQNLFNAFNAPIMEVKNGKKIQFARADISDAERIEKLSDNVLISEALSMSYMITYAAFSLCDIQIESIYNAEITSRGLEKKAEIEWKKIELNEAERSLKESKDCK